MDRTIKFYPSLDKELYVEINQVIKPVSEKYL